MKRYSKEAKPKRRTTNPWAERKIKPRSQWKQYERPGGGYLHDEAELARDLGEERRTIRSWRLSGVIPAVILGSRTIRYRLPNVIAALEKRTVREVEPKKAGQ